MRRNRNNNPCFGCAERHLKCHAECEKYKAWLEDYRDKHKGSKRRSEFVGYVAERQLKIIKAKKGRFK